MSTAPRARRRAYRPQDASPKPHPPAPGYEGTDQVHVWQPPSVVKVTTQMTLEHRQLMAYLEATTGKRLWELVGEAIDQTYGTTSRG